MQCAVEPVAGLKPQPNARLRRLENRSDCRRRHRSLAIPGQNGKRPAPRVHLAKRRARAVGMVDKAGNRGAFSNLIGRDQRALPCKIPVAAACVVQGLLKIVGAVAGKLIGVLPALDVGHQLHDLGQLTHPRRTPSPSARPPIRGRSPAGRSGSATAHRWSSE